MTLSVQQGRDEVLDVVASGIRPSAVLDMVAAHEVMTAIQSQDVRRGGCWLFSANVWQRFERPWGGPDTPDGAQLVGTVYVTHGAPTAYGEQTGWEPTGVLNDALALAGLSLRDCGPIQLP
jgi:hypothetical protein